MKGVEILKSRYKLILGYTGVILLGVSIAMLTPLLTIPFFSYKKLEIFAFIVTAFFTAVIGFNLKKFVDKETNVTMSIQEGGIVVLLSWITTLILSALPFVISGQLNFVQAMFGIYYNRAISCGCKRDYPYGFTLEKCYAVSWWSWPCGNYALCHYWSTWGRAL